MDLVDRHMPDDYGRVADIFRERVAYGRFKDFVDSREQLDAW